MNNLVWIRFVIPEEGIYEGFAIGKRRNNRGALYSLDNKFKIYDGNWKDDKPSGFGVRQFKSGDQHRGNYEFGLRNGHGLYLWQNGDRYVGGWQNNEMHGEGTFKWVCGDTYVGSWCNGLMEGRGSKVQSDGSIVQGTFRKGKVHGQAEKSYPNGDCYRGEYEDDQRHGHGLYIWRDDSEYEGSWVRDEMHGVGCRAARSAQTAGERARARLLGVAVSAEDPVAHYRGEFRHGQRCGQGRAVYWDERTYCGGWRNDKMDGWGRCEYPYAGGASYVGDFRCGMREGVGIMQFGEDSIKNQNDSTSDGDELLLEIERRPGDVDISIDPNVDIMTILLNYSSEIGVCSYHGGWSLDQPHGSGIVTFSNEYVRLSIYITNRAHFLLKISLIRKFWDFSFMEKK